MLKNKISFKKQIKKKLLFNRLIYSFFSIFLIIMLYVSLILTQAVMDDLNHAKTHDKKLKDEYNDRMEYYNQDPQNRFKPYAPEYIFMDTFLIDLPYLLFGIGLIVFVYIIIAMSFFFLFPPLHHNNKYGQVLGGISRIILINDTEYIIFKTSYFSKNILVSMDNVVIGKSYNSLLTTTKFLINLPSVYFINEDVSGNYFIHRHEYEHKIPNIDEYNNTLNSTIRKGVSLVKNASKSNYLVATKKELETIDDVLLNEAQQEIDTDIGN